MSDESVVELVARLGGLIAYHRERESFHAQQEGYHHEQRAVHAGELEVLQKHREALGTAVAAGRLPWPGGHSSRHRRAWESTSERADESQLPEAWYNINADLPVPPQPHSTLRARPFRHDRLRALPPSRASGSQISDEQVEEA